MNYSQKISRRIRVLLADDHRLVRQGLRQICEIRGGFDVIGEAENGYEAIAMVKRLSPDVILMDISMPELNGVEATRRILENDPDANVIVLTMYDKDEYLFEAIKAGAKGYLLKDIDRQELVNAVNKVYEGGALINSMVANRLLDEFRNLDNVPEHDDVLEEKMENLTPAESDILRLIAQGLENHEIAEQLSFSIKTIENRLTEIYKKLRVNNRTQAAIYALKKGLSSLSDIDETPNIAP